MECQRNEGLEAAGFILQLAKPNQVIDAVAGLLDVAIKHGGIGAQIELVSFAMNANPGVGVGLVLANLVADFRMEDFSAAARQAAQADFFEFSENIPSRQARQAREPIPLHRRVSFQMQARMSLVDDFDDVEIPFIRKLMMQSADNVKLGGTVAFRLRGTI